MESSGEEADAPPDRAWRGRLAALRQLRDVSEVDRLFYAPSSRLVYTWILGFFAFFILFVALNFAGFSSVPTTPRSPTRVFFQPQASLVPHDLETLYTIYAAVPISISSTLLLISTWSSPLKRRFVLPWCAMQWLTVAGSVANLLDLMPIVVNDIGIGRNAVTRLADLLALMVLEAFPCMIQGAISPWSNPHLGLVLALDFTYKPIGYLFRSFPTDGLRVAAFFISLFLGTLLALVALTPCACHPRVAQWTAPSLARVVPVRVRDHEILPDRPPDEEADDSPTPSSVPAPPARNDHLEERDSADPESGGHTGAASGEAGSGAAKRGGQRHASDAASSSATSPPVVAIEKVSLLTPTEAWWIIFAIFMNRTWQIALWTVYALLQRSTSDLSRLLLLGQLVSSLIIPGSAIHLAFARFDLARMRFLAIQRDAHAQTRMRAQQAMLRWVCHEVRVPLNTVVLGSEHVSSDVAAMLPPESATPAQREVQARIYDTLRVMQDATKGMHAVVSDMLAYEKAGHGKVELREERACVTTLCDDVVREFRSEADVKGITFDRPSTERPVIAKLDVARLKQVTRNYVSNALKFSRPDSTIRVTCAVFVPDDAAAIAPRWEKLGRGMRHSVAMRGHSRQGRVPRRDDHDLSAAETSVYTCSASLVARSGASRGPEGSCTAHVSAVAPGAYAVLCISVRDQGHGMNPEQQRKLFQPFSQLRTGVEGRGTGLGLAICRAIAAVHGGTVGCHSDVGRGSEFWIEVPIQTLSSGAIVSAQPSHSAAEDSSDLRVSPPRSAASRTPSQRPTPALELPPLPSAMAASARGDGPVDLPFSPFQAGAADESHPVPAPSRQLPSVPALPVLGEGPRPPSAGVSDRHAITEYNGLRVLVVDDVSGNRSLLARTIRGFGAASVAECENGARAVQELARASAEGKPFHVVFLDKEMPVVDGYGVLDRLHAASSGAAVSEGPPPTLGDLEVEPQHAAAALRHCCVIAVTGNALESDVTDFKRRGAHAVLRKPVTRHELRAVGSVVESHLETLGEWTDEDNSAASATASPLPQIA